jgi:hypothetical protein
MQSGQSGGGGGRADRTLTLQTLSSEERLRRAPFLTDLDALTILEKFLRTNNHLAPSIPAYACTKSARCFTKVKKDDRAGRAWHCMCVLVLVLSA